MNPQELARVASATPTAVSRATGVSRSTLRRIAVGEVVPALATVREIALFLGYDATIEVRQASDPQIARAVRHLLDPAFENQAQTEGDQEWCERLRKWNVSDPDELVAVAGRLSTPGIRPGARWFSTRDGLDLSEVVGNAGLASRGEYAVSGSAAASVILGRKVLGPTILWARNADQASRALSDTLRVRDGHSPSGVVVVPAMESELVDPYEARGVQWAAPIQVVIDLHALQMKSVAEAITEGWGSGE